MEAEHINLNYIWVVMILHGAISIWKQQKEHIAGCSHGMS